MTDINFFFSYSFLCLKIIRWLALVTFVCFQFVYMKHVTFNFTDFKVNFEIYVRSLVW